MTTPNNPTDPIPQSVTLQQALDCIRCSTEFKIGNPAFEQCEAALAAALSNPPAPEQASGELLANAEEIQWRNIRKVVRALADLCFGSKDDPRWGIAWISIVNSLTAKDGLDSSTLGLERLTATPTAEPVGEPNKCEETSIYCCEFCFSSSGKTFLDRMILCPDCGNKRCPKATHHDNACTNSNASWEHVKPLSASPAAPEAAKALHVQAVKLTDAQREALTVKNDVYIPGAVAQPEQQAQAWPHQWDDAGECCIKCGDKDWMGGPCSVPSDPLPPAKPKEQQAQAGEHE